MEENRKNKVTIADKEKLFEKFLDKLPEILNGKLTDDNKDVVTLRVFKNEYLDLVKNNLSPSYYKSVRLSFDHLLSYFKPQKAVNSFNQKEIEKFMSYLKVNVPKGYRIYYRNLKAAFNKAYEWNYLNENLFKNVKLPKRQLLAPAFVNSIQFSAICDKIKKQTVKDITVFAFNTGMRLDEVINLKWSNIDYANRTITVGDEGFTTKGRKQRFIPMTNEVYELLVKCEMAKVNETSSLPIIHSINNSCDGKRDASLSRSMTNVYVFCKENGFKYSKDYVSKKFKEACRKANIDKSIHFHSLRHSFASYLVQQGVSLPTIKDLLGHTSITTTEIYSHLDLTSLKEAVKKFDKTNDGDSDYSNENNVNQRTAAETNSKQEIQRNETSLLTIYKINAGGIK